VSGELSATSDEDQPLVKRLKTTEGPKLTAPPTGRSAGRGKCIPEVEDKVSKRMAAAQKGKGKGKGTGKRNTGKGRTAAAKGRAKAGAGKKTTGTAKGNLGTDDRNAGVAVEDSGAPPASANTVKPKPPRSGKAKDVGVTKARRRNSFQLYVLLCNCVFCRAIQVLRRAHTGANRCGTVL
jgi:hypothetical protein